MDASPSGASVLLSSILTPAKGLHTTSSTRLALRGPHPRRCTLHLYFALPTQLFADPYELAHRRASYAFERFGGGDLEAPVFAPGAGGGGPSGLLLDVLVPERIVSDDDGIGRGEGSSSSSSIVEVDVPLHARYGVPKTGGELTDEVALPPPEAFWACPSSGRDTESHHYYFLTRLSSAFLCTAKRTQVPDALRKVVELAPALIRGGGAERTLVSIPHAESVRMQTLRVPVGDAGDVAFVETGTVVVVLLAFVFLLRTIVNARTRHAAVPVSAAKKNI